MWDWLACPPIQIKDIPSIVRERTDFIEEFGESPDLEKWVYPCYKRLPMGLGHSVRITLAINQRRIHIALFGSARLLHLLYPKLILIIGQSQNGLREAAKFFRFPVFPVAVDWNQLSRTELENLSSLALKGTFS